MNRPTFTEIEDQYIRDYYPSQPTWKIAGQLNRDAGKIVKRANYLGLRKAARIEADPQEVKYVAYKDASNEMQEFNSVEEVGRFFKISPASVKTLAGSAHVTGGRINHKWYLFNSSKKTSYVKSIIGRY